MEGGGLAKDLPFDESIFDDVLERLIQKKNSEGRNM